MANIITRVGYCSNCERNRSPRTGQQFLAYGSSTNSYKVLEAQRNGIIGYTPTIYKLDKVIGANVVVLISCAMYECGVERRIESGYWYYSVKAFRREIWKLECWNELVLLKNNQFTYQFEI